MKKTILTVIMLFAVLAAGAQIIYITPDGSGLNDGSTWENALGGNAPSLNGYTKLADTMQFATSGNQFWIAEGTYKACTDSDREKSFRLAQGVRIYGGFEGTETDTIQRTIELHPTVFSGDIGMPGDSTDNSKLIFNVVAGGGMEYSLLDGIDIRYGYHEDWGAYASGILNVGHLRIANCQLSLNYGQQYGGAILNSGELIMQNCSLGYNISDMEGGGLYNSGHATVIACKFYNNHCNSWGGAIYNSLDLTVINSLIVNNGANSWWGGGGIATQHYAWLDIANAWIYNSTIANNDGNLLIAGGNISVINSVVWGSGIKIYPNPSSLDLRNSIIQDYSGNPLVLNANPLFVNPTPGSGSGYMGLSSDWSLKWCSPGIDMGVDTLIPSGIMTDLNGNPRILYSQVDLGAYEHDTTGIVVHNVNFSSAHICVSDTTVYAGDGSSWAYALAGNSESCRYPGQTLLYEAMKDASPGTEIWVKKGTYRCSLQNNRSHAFDIGDGVQVYGGFAGNETSLEVRNTTINKTIFSGNIGDSLVSTDNSYHVLNLNPGGSVFVDSALMDNIIVGQGYADGTSPSSEGGGIIINPNTRFEMRDSEIRNNRSAGNGAGINLKPGARVSLNHCRILMNETFVFPQPPSSPESANGAGIFNQGNLKMTNCSVIHNNNATLGAGICNVDSLVLINTSVDTNVCLETYLPHAMGGGIFNAGFCKISGGTVNGNYTFTRGGGISNMQGAVMTVNNTSVSGNSCGLAWGNSYGGGLYNEGIMIVDGCRISNNAALVGGGGAYNPTMVRNSIIVNNSISGPANSGGGLWIRSGCQGILNSTIANNIGEGIAAASADTFQVINSIVYGNEVQLSGHFTLANSCVEKTMSGNGNIFAYPLWINPSAGKGAAFDGLSADWGLQPYSPCVNNGNNAFLSASDSIDAAGHFRLMFGTVDIGGMESQVPPDTVVPVLHHVICEIFRPKPASVQNTDAVPWQSVVLPSLETSLPGDLSFQSRIRGFILPPVNGYYRFYMASDIGGKFYLSADSSEYFRRLILSNEGGNGSWPDTLGCVDSIFLEAQKPYYFELFCRNSDTPLNFLKIGWALPGNNHLQVISGEFLKCAKPKQQLSVDWEIFKNKTTYDFSVLKNTCDVPDEILKLDSVKTVDRSTRMDFFSSRIRGYLIPPVSGNYEFYFACDNVGQFWLSTDSTASNAGLKSEIFSADADWYQHISTQELIAGQKYYFEILHYDTAFTDLVKLGWKIPGESQPVVLKSPWITSCYDMQPAVKLHLTDSIVELYPGVNKTPKFHLTPWNTDFKGIRWTSSDDAVATVDCYGKITAVAPGNCRVVASLTEHPAARDSLVVIISGYYGPFYVRENAIATGSGQSWDDPVGLAKLLEFLGQGPLPGQVTVYVGEGVHQPTETIDRNKTFSLNKIRLLGGYSAQSSGTDTTLRSFEDHETILSGEIGDQETTIDNSYHVVSMAGNAAVDGLTIRDGRASCSTYGSTPGYYAFKQDDNGGGIFVTGQGNIIRNCRILHNSAWNRGGGIYTNWCPPVQMDSDEVAENLIQQEAITNWGIFVLYINGNGAGMATVNSTVYATNCIFHHNGPTVGMGTAAYIGGGSGTFTGCSFYSNFGNFGVGKDLYVSAGGFNLQNSTVSGSLGICYGGGNITNTTILGSIMNGCNPYDNNISLDNSFATSVDSSVFNAANTTVRYSIIGSNLYGENKETLISDTVQPSNIWLDTLAYNGGITPTMRLKNIPANPAKTHGNTAYLGTTDQRGYTRTDTVSIGAYQWVWPSQITINPQQAFIAPGDTLPFTVTVLPAWADDPAWSVASSDSLIVGIAGNTMVAQSEGNARVMVRTNDGNRRDTCFVMVMTDSVGVNGIVHNGNSNCYSALGVITVAGSGTSFVMQPGSNSVMIAGEKIFYLPGTTVKAGGFMHGYIAPQGPWCNDYKSSEDIVQMREIDPQGTAISTGMEFVKVWPNPTTGMLYLAINPRDLITPVQATIFSFLGEVVFQDSYMGKTTTSISLESLPPGMYLLQLVQGDKRESVKLIKQ
jgi:uncharacterized protein YjdB